MGPSSILSVIHIITIETMLNNNHGNNCHGLKNVKCKQTFTLFNFTELIAIVTKVNVDGFTDTELIV